MEDLRGRTAVVTGAASGIGRAMVERFAAEGMHLVLADIEEAPLEAAAEELRDGGAEVLAVRTDVSSRTSLDELAGATFEAFGPPAVLCNNAGVSGGGGPLWSTTEKDWEWVLGVNLMGVVHGIQAFVPAMVESGQPGHVVNTSSVMGLQTGAGSPYGVSKHAVTRLSEGLWYDLQAAGAPIGVSVLCPGLIATRIVTAARNRPDHLRNEATGEQAASSEMMAAAEKRFLTDGMPPADVAEMVLEAIRDDRFYVLTHDWIKVVVRDRYEAILDGKQPPAVRAGAAWPRRGKPTAEKSSS